MLVFKVHVKKAGIYLGGNNMEGTEGTAGRSLELLLKSEGMI